MAQSYIPPVRFPLQSYDVDPFLTHSPLVGSNSSMGQRMQLERRTVGQAEGPPISVKVRGSKTSRRLWFGPEATEGVEHDSWFTSVLEGSYWSWWFGVVIGGVCGSWQTAEPRDSASGEEDGIGIEGAPGSKGMVSWAVVGMGRRKRRLRLIRRPDPPILIAYWSNPRVSTTVPTLYHLRGWLPVWFWRNTRSPQCKAPRGRLFLRSAASLRPARRRRVSSFALHASRHVRRIERLVNLDKRLTKEKASRKGRPNTISAGDISQSGSGVLRNFNSARKNESLFKSPLELTLAINRRLAAFIAT